METQMKRFHAAITATVLLLTLNAIFLPAVHGQATFGTISGNVTDPANAAIPNAQVTITDTEHGGIYQTLPTPAATIRRRICWPANTKLSSRLRFW